MANFAKHLVFELFQRDELKGKNCAGVQGKQGIGNDPRTELVQMQHLKDIELLIKILNVCRNCSYM